MNEIMEKRYAVLKLYQPLRDEVMEALTDEDLAFQAEDLPSVGELCVQMGDWQQSYIDGFKHFKQDFENHNDDPELLKSVAKLNAWYAKLDAELEKVVEGLSDDEVENKKIDRGGWEASAKWSLEIYQECLIIFYAKMYMYFKLMGKELPKGLAHWVE
jgi:hypothetical protein